MATTVAVLEARLEAVTRDFNQKIGAAERKLQGLGNTAPGVVSKLGGITRVFGLIGVAAAGVKFGQFVGSAVTAASDVNESINAVKVVFGEAAQKILDFSSDTEDAMFETESNVNQMSVVVGSLLQNFGFDADTAADKTIMLSKRAGDMASVFNTDVSQAIGAIGSALRGETEPIRIYGVNVDEASTKAQALADGIWDGVGALTQEEKIAARINIIMDQTQRVHGDAARTADEFANKQRSLNEKWEEAKVALGEKLIPILEEDLLPALEDLIGPLGTVFGLLGDVIGLAMQPLKIFGIGKEDFGDHPLVVLLGTLEKLEDMDIDVPDWIIDTGDIEAFNDLIESEFGDAIDYAEDRLTDFLGAFNPVSQAFRGTADDAGVMRARLQGHFQSVGTSVGTQIRDPLEAAFGRIQIAVAQVRSTFETEFGAINRLDLRQLEARFTEVMQELPLRVQEEMPRVFDYMQQGISDAVSAIASAETKADAAAAIAALGEHIRAQQSFQENLTKLSEAGLDALVNTLSTHPNRAEAIAAAAHLAENIGQAFDLETELDKAALQGLYQLGLTLGSTANWSSALTAVRNAGLLTAQEYLNAWGSAVSAGFIVPIPSTPAPPSGTSQLDWENLLFGYQHGGFAAARTPILVGERGPELFVPGRGGTVIPNYDLPRGGGSIVVNVFNEGSVVTERELVDTVMDGVLRATRHGMGSLN